MNGFKTTTKIQIPEYINWNFFNIKDNDASSVIIYIPKLKKDITGDIEKIAKLKQMSNLQSIVINTPDFNIGIYMSEILKDFPKNIRKEFNLLDDFKNMDRSSIDLTKLAEGTNCMSIPNSYIQWGVKKKQLNYGYYELNSSAIVLFDSADSACEYPSKEAFDKITQIITEFSQIPDLSTIDKVVLVANYLQQNVQFVSGKISETVDGDYECEDYSYEKFRGINSVDNVLFDNIGKCNCISRTMMLMLNNPIMNVNCRIVSAPGHAYCAIYDDETGQLYCTDPTWCISRNPNRFEETLKASKFYDEYLFIGKDKLSIMDHHNTINILLQDFDDTSISREKIQSSVEKLKKYGISFEYPEIIPLSSKKVQRTLENKAQ